MLKLNNALRVKLKSNYKIIFNFKMIVSNVRQFKKQNSNKYLWPIVSLLASSILITDSIVSSSRESFSDWTEESKSSNWVVFVSSEHGLRQTFYKHMHVYWYKGETRFSTWALHKIENKKKTIISWFTQRILLKSQRHNRIFFKIHNHYTPFDEPQVPDMVVCWYESGVGIVPSCLC